MTILKRFPLIAVFLLLGNMSSAAESPQPTSSAGVIRQVRIAGVINPVVAGYITDQLLEANRVGAEAFLLELDTPGGLDTAMRQIIQGELGSSIPVIVYVAPAGARAASAGALITLAADFAVMAPGTNLGAAHPVSIGIGKNDDETMTTKVVNDAVAYARSIAAQRGRNLEWAEQVVRMSISTPATEAVALKVVDLVAPDRETLLKELDGCRYLRDGKDHFLHSQEARIEEVAMPWRLRILNALSDPTVAYLLMMLGIIGIFFEISQPGVILPGVIGAMALLLALFAFQTLPVNYTGVLFILLSLVLFVLEIKITSYGMLTVGGIIAMALGSLMLIDSSAPYLQISRVVIVATVAVSSGLFAMVLFFVVRTQRSRFVSGAEGMVGERGIAVTAIESRGKVFVHGEYWDAVTIEPMAEGEEIEVVSVAPGLRLVVKKVENPAIHS